MEYAELKTVTDPNILSFNIQENINLLVVENMTTPEVAKLNKPQIEFMKSVRSEIDKWLEDYDKMNK
jgi:predicted Fe-Mo cluster-binding NifX family protein